jgi:hypothetical protein
MKHATGRTSLIHATRAPAVDVERERGMLKLTITIPAQGATRQARLGDPRLKENVKELVEGVLLSPRPTASVKRLAAQISAAQAGSAQSAAQQVEPTVTRTKQAQGTIGVTCSVHMREVILQEADERNVALSALARQMFEAGLARLEERLWEEPSQKVLSDFNEVYRHFSADETMQWSLRIPRRAFLRARLLAQEHGISLSQLACVCLAVGLDLVMVG